MHANDQSIYDCTFAPAGYQLPDNLDIKQTYNAVKKRLYLHLFTYPSDGKLVLPGYADKISYAQFLNDASEVLYKKEAGNIVLQLPKQKPPYEVPVIELFLK